MLAVEYDVEQFFILDFTATLLLLMVTLVLDFLVILHAFFDLVAF